MIIISKLSALIYFWGSQLVGSFYLTLTRLEDLETKLWAVAFHGFFFGVHGCWWGYSWYFSGDFSKWFRACCSIGGVKTLKPLRNSSSLFVLLQRTVYYYCWVQCSVAASTNRERAWDVSDPACGELGLGQHKAEPCCAPENWFLGIPGVELECPDWAPVSD